MPKQTIRPLSPELLDDYLTFFDHDAFRDNPEWRSCYCAYYHFYTPARDQEWEQRTGEQNRALARELILAGRMHGYLAYQGGQMVGWCHAAPRADLPLLPEILDLASEDAGGVGAVVCFVVAQSCRRQGVARQLLHAACAGFRALGLAYAEAYPFTGRHTDAGNCHGPLAMYLDAGFQTVRTREDALVVRKELQPRPG